MCSPARGFSPGGSAFASLLSSPNLAAPGAWLKRFLFQRKGEELKGFEMHACPHPWDLPLATLLQQPEARGRRPGKRAEQKRVGTAKGVSGGAVFMSEICS